MNIWLMLFYFTNSTLASYKSQGFGFVAFLLTRLFTILHSSKYAQFESSSTMILPALMSETTSGKKEGKLRTQLFLKHFASNLDQYLIDTRSYSSFTIEDEKIDLEDPMNLSSNSSETRLSEDFDYLLNMIFSSPSPIITDSQILADNPEVSTEKNVTQTFHQPSQPTISKTIFLSNLPVTVNRRQLRTMFPRCNKIVLKTNHWNKDLRLQKR